MGPPSRTRQVNHSGLRQHVQPRGRAVQSGPTSPVSCAMTCSRLPCSGRQSMHTWSVGTPVRRERRLKERGVSGSTV